MWIKQISIWKASRWDSLWNRGERQLGNGLFVEVYSAISFFFFLFFFFLFSFFFFLFSFFFFSFSFLFFFFFFFFLFFFFFFLFSFFFLHTALLVLKGRGQFPCHVSVLEIHDDLDWNPDGTTLGVGPLYICEDGAVIFYRYLKLWKPLLWLCVLLSI